MLCDNLEILINLFHSHNPISAIVMRLTLVFAGPLVVMFSSSILINALMKKSFRRRGPYFSLLMLMGIGMMNTRLLHWLMFEAEMGYRKMCL